MSTNNSISDKEIKEAQIAWGEGLVKIGEVYRNGGDYKAAALQLIESLYYYQNGPVLFNPTLTYERQFRTTIEGALSYFVGGNDNFPEDKGFAIKERGWASVRWDNIGNNATDVMAVAMGVYYFSPINGGDPVQVDYSFAYKRDETGKLRIVLHSSHLPYKPTAE